MRFGIATKVFLGFSAILAMSALVSVFGIVQMHQIGQGLALVSTGYFPLSPIAGSLDAFEKERERSTERLIEERDAKVRRSLLRLDRIEFARIADDFLARAKAHVAAARESASSPRDREALDKIDTRLSLLAARIAEQNQNALALQALNDEADRQGLSLDRLPEAVDPIARLRTSERRVDHEIKALLNVIQEQMNIGVEEAEKKERATRLAVLGLSALALGLGLLLTWLSNRALRPIVGLTEAVQRLGRGAPDLVAVPERGGDELAVLAHEFNAMAQRLAARERQLRAQGEALVRSERLAAIGRIAAQITHEIRNPLSSISLNAEELGERLRESQEPGAAALCDAIVREVDRLAAVTEEYLRFARLPKPQLAPSDLNDAIRDLLDFVRSELTSAGISLRAAARTGSSRGAGRRRADPAAAPEPRPQCAGGDARRRRRVRGHPLRRRGRLRRGPRHGPGHPSRAPRAHLRSLLHHQGAGDRARPRPRAGDRAGAFRAAHGRLCRGPGHHLHPTASARSGRAPRPGVIPGGGSRKHRMRVAGADAAALPTARCT
jgi:C4-dicarboxylate-specific signal transduction histidine kinase